MKQIIEKLYEQNNKFRNPYTGLYVASTNPKYCNYTWIRDVYYQAKPNLKHNPDSYIHTYRSLLDYYKGLNYKYDDKINELIRKPFPINNMRFIHPRFYPNMKEITADWGNLQLDTFGYFFLGISEGTLAGLEIIRDKSDIDIINDLVQVLNKIHYWKIKDNGIWEENDEIHASSIGAVVSGLLALEKIDIAVPRKMIYEGKKVLKELLPRESVTKNVDLALLTLIYPFDIIKDEDLKLEIIKNVQFELESNMGVIRYKDDKYYNINGEAEWCFGFSFLYFATGDSKYIDLILKTIDSDGRIPELFYSNTQNPNDNNPLGWAVAMAILALEDHLFK